MLADILTVLLAVVVALIPARLAIQMSRVGSTHWRHYFIEFRLDKIADITMFGLSILFVVWFRRARINAERSAYRQRRARGWAFWGWIVPIVSLWIPFQIMGDIWRAGLPAAQWRKTAWLPVLWWTCWLVSGRDSVPRQCRRTCMASRTSPPEASLSVCFSSPSRVPC
jgi:Domain of unknown function (DUF4328)